MYGMFGCAEKLNIQNYKFNGKLFTLYMYEKFGFAKKLNIQNCENATGNCVQYICMERKDLLKN